ncbi:hypothetical protein L0F63_002271 [Massospora cicadina]|nr:hypothetical protein L0F63_002271 [Massospora cicadina]
MEQLNEEGPAIDHAWSPVLQKFTDFPDKVPAPEINRDFYNELRQPKEELIALTAKRREQFALEAQLRARSTPSQGNEWLNGDAINASLGLLAERSNRPVPGHMDLKYPNVISFPTYFFHMLRNQGYAKVARQAKKKQIFSKDVLLVPIHLGNHWTLVTIDFRHKLISYFDSLLGDPAQIIKLIVQFLNEASQDILKVPFNMDAWRIDVPKFIPAQSNSFDCGMFCIMFCKSVASPFYPPEVPATFPFGQADMRKLRLLISYEVITGKLLHN